MLTRIEIEKFRSCENVVLDGLSGITALVGRNGAGKTNILQAIDWAARAATDAGPIETIDWFENDSVALHLTLPDGRCIYRFKTTHETARDFAIHESFAWEIPDGQYESVFQREGSLVVINDSQSIQIGAKSAALPAMCSILPSEAPVLQRVIALQTFLRSIRYYPLDEPSPSNHSAIVSEDEYRKWVADHSLLDVECDSVLFPIMQMKFDDPGTFDHLKALLGNSGLGLIDDISVEELESSEHTRPSAFYMVAFKLPGDLRRFRWDRLSLGTRRVVRLLISLVYDHSSVMLIEHPEDGIHRGLLWKTVGLLKAYTDPMQVILASHSSVVLNSLEPEEVRLVSMESGKTALRSLSGREIELATHFLAEEGTLEDFLDTIQQED